MKWVVPITLWMVCAMTSVSAASGIGVRVESGTVLPYEAPEEVGNGVAVHLTYDLASFQVSVGGGLVFPGSRVEGPLVTGQLMTQWHPSRASAWAQRLALSPYVSLGLGLAGFADEERAGETFESADSIRWIHGSEHLTGLLGLGITYGAAESLLLTLEARAVNHTHLAFVLGAGRHF